LSGLSLKQWKTFRVKVNHLARIVFVIPFRLLFQTLFDLFLDLRKTFDSVFQTPIPMIDALMNREILFPASFQYLVDRGPGRMILKGQISNPDFLFVKPGVNLLTLQQRQPCSFVYYHWESPFCPSLTN